MTNVVAPVYHRIAGHFAAAAPIAQPDTATRKPAMTPLNLTHDDFAPLAGNDTPRRLGVALGVAGAVACGALTYQLAAASLPVAATSGTGELGQLLALIEADRIGSGPILYNALAQLTHAVSLLSTGLTLLPRSTLLLAPALRDAVVLFMSGSTIWLVLALAASARVALLQSRITRHRASRTRPGHACDPSLEVLSLETISKQSWVLALLLGSVSIVLPMAHTPLHLAVWRPLASLCIGFALSAAVELWRSARADQR